MKIFCIVSQKGGVGKTTTVCNLAGHFSHEGKRVAILDLDPNGRAAFTIAQKSEGALKDNVAMIEEEELYKAVPYIEQIIDNDLADVILIDTPPRLKEVLTVVLSIINRFDVKVIVPIKPGATDTAPTMNTIESIQHSYDGKIYLLPNCTRRNNLMTSITMSTFADLAGTVLLPQIYDRAPIAQALQMGKTIQEHDKDCARFYKLAVNKIMDDTPSLKEVLDDKLA